MATSSLEYIAARYQQAKEFDEIIKPRILLSYFYARKWNIRQLISDFLPDVDLFLDSGAYSAMTLGVNISIHDYGMWLQNHCDLASCFANLDVIGDAKRTMRHQEILEKEYGLTPLPVFHIGEPKEYLTDYLDHHPCVGLGVAGKDYRHYRSWVLSCFQHTADRFRFHGFGITVWEIIKKLPWYSVDSSTWSMTRRENEFRIFDEQEGMVRKMYLHHFHSKNEWERNYLYGKELRQYRIIPSLLSGRTKEREDHVTSLSLLAYWQAERYLERYWDI